MNFCTNGQCTNSGPTKMNLFLENLFLSTAAFSIIHLAPIPYIIPFWKTHGYNHCIWTWHIFLLKPIKHTIHGTINLLKHFFWEPLLELTILSTLTHLWQDKTNSQWCKDRAIDNRKEQEISSSLKLLVYAFKYMCTCVRSTRSVTAVTH